MANNSRINFTFHKEPSRFRINTKYFSAHDLNLFVESLETIQRLKIEKEERKQREKIKQLKRKSSNRFCATLARICSETTLDSSAGSSADEVEDEPLMHLGNKKKRSSTDSHRSECDESYFSAPNSTESSPRSSIMYQQKPNTKPSGCAVSTSTSSDSEESGVFPIATSSPDIFEPRSSPFRPRSRLISKSRSLSTKSRLIGLVSKRECAKAPSVELISCRHLDEYETLEMNEQEQQQQQRDQYLMYLELQAESQKSSRFSTLHTKMKNRQGFVCLEGSAEERFLNKALRYLTL